MNAGPHDEHGIDSVSDVGLPWLTTRPGDELVDKAVGMTD